MSSQEPSGEPKKYLEKEGLEYLIGKIKYKLDAKANVGDSYTKSEANSAHNNLTSAINANTASITALQEQVGTGTGLGGRVQTLENKMNTVQGSESTTGSIKKALKDAKDYTGAEIKKITLAQNKDNSLTYDLKYDNTTLGSVNIPKDQFLDDVSYNSNTQTLTFTFQNRTTGKPASVEIPLTALVDDYTGGDGISVSDTNEISIKLANDNTTSFINFTDNGELSADGVASRIASLDADVGEALSGVRNNADNIETVNRTMDSVKNQATTNKGNIASLQSKTLILESIVSSNESSITKIENWIANPLTNTEIETVWNEVFQITDGSDFEVG